MKAAFIVVHRLCLCYNIMEMWLPHV